MAERDDELEKHTEPPVVARLVIEIRSDGSRTIARGAMEDATAGARVAIQAEGTTPMQLVGALARELLKGLGTGAIARALLRSKRPR
jgi:hypothetical protein